MELPEMIKFETQWSTRKLHLACDINYAPQCDAFQRDRMTPSKRVQVNAPTVIRANHGEAGKSAFCCFGLLNNREPTLTKEISFRHDHILTLSRGSRIHLINERLSKMMSAFKSISACRGIFFP